MRKLAAALAVVLTAAACTGSDDPGETTAAPTSPPTSAAPPETTGTGAPPPTEAPATTEPAADDGTVIPPDGGPTQASLDADREFRAVPAAFEDCGTTVLTSGWPTTTAYFIERADCILDAAAAGTPSQHSYTGRNQAGGMRGTILRVLGPDEILMIDYVVSPLGTVTTEEVTCTELTTADVLPACA